MDDKIKNENYNKDIRTLYDSEKWEERAAAVKRIGDTMDGRATNILAKILKSEKDEVVINRIIEAMGNIKDVKATIFILEVLRQELEKPEDEQNKKRLFVIIESLMKIGDKRALADLGILLNSCDAEIQSLTEEAFECIDPNWKENIKKL